jgi:hypothetical protein
MSKTLKHSVSLYVTQYTRVRLFVLAAAILSSLGTWCDEKKKPDVDLHHT